MEVIIQKNNVIFDATLASSLMGCARLTDFRFNYNFISIGGKSPSLEMGSIVHSILEHFNKAIIDGKGKGNSVAIGMQAGRDYTCDPDKVRNSSPEDIELVFKTMEEYFDYYRNDSWIPLEVEVVKSRIIYEDDEMRILWKCKIDLMVDTNQGIYSLDHKTMRQRRDTVSLNNQFMGQCAVLGTKKVIINKIGFQTSLKNTEKFTRPSVDYNEARLKEWTDDIIPNYARMMLFYTDAGYWPPNYTHCENKFGMCQFKEVCEAPPNLRENELTRLFMKGEKWDPTNPTKEE